MSNHKSPERHALSIALPWVMLISSVLYTADAGWQVAVLGALFVADRALSEYRYRILEGGLVQALDLGAMSTALHVGHLDDPEDREEIWEAYQKYRLARDAAQ